MNVDRDRIRDRLRRLMSMTTENGASEAEALAASEMAARLMAEHNLTYRTVEEIDAENFRDDKRPWFRGGKGRRKSAPIPPIARCLPGICKLCSVEHHFDTWTGDLTFFGAPCDTDVAHYLTTILSRAMEREWQRHRRQVPAAVARRQRASFFTAVSVRIAIRLNEMTKQSWQANGTGLVPIKDALLKDRYAAVHGDTSFRDLKLNQQNTAGLAAGWRAGGDVALSKGVTEAHGAMAITQQTETTDR